MDDVIALLDPASRKATAIYIDIPTDLTADCRPDQISAVSSILLHHLLQGRPNAAIAVIGARGQEATCIRISSRALVLNAEELRCMSTRGVRAVGMERLRSAPDPLVSGR